MESKNGSINWVDIAELLVDSDDKLALQTSTTFKTFEVRHKANAEFREVPNRGRQQNYSTNSQNGANGKK